MILFLAASMGPDVVPVIIGQFVDETPSVVTVATLGCVVGCALLFATAAGLANLIKKKKSLVAVWISSSMILQ